MRSLALLAATSTLALAGCSAFSDDAGGDGVQVVAAFYPLEFVTARVAGDHAEVVALARTGAEPHDMELNIKDTGEIARADLVVYEHLFQPAVDAAVEENAEGETLDAAEAVGLIPFEESPEEHAEHEEHPEDAEEDAHEHGDLDPHFWQDPARMADLGDAVAEELAGIDPDHAEDYEANAADLRADLEALDAAYETGLADCERDTIVVSHDAFGYLEKYGLRLASVVGLTPEAEPTGAVIGELQELIETEGITTVFSERLEPELTDALVADLDIRTAVLDPVEGLTDETADQDYVSLMEQNLDALREANGCR